MSLSYMLVTGGCGFIGSNFINYCKRKYPHIFIVNIDRLDYCAHTGNIEEPRDRYVFVKGDICDSGLVSAVLKEYPFEVVVHIAAQSHVDNSFGNSLSFTRDNTLGTHILIESCRQYAPRLKRFLYFSTDEVYGEVSPDDVSHETSLLCPTNPYAASKAAAELIVKSYIHSFNMPVIITRCNNVYGRYQYPEKVVARFICLLLENKPCTVHGQGLQRRNYIHADDVSSAVDVILQKGKPGSTYNIGTHNEYTTINIARKLIGMMKGTDVDPDKWIVFTEDPRPFNDTRYNIDSSKLRELGWSESVPFDSGLRETIDWYTHSVSYPRS